MKRINGEDTSTVSPTLGFNIKTMQFHDGRLNIWDVGGQKTLRSYWRNYYEQVCRYLAQCQELSQQCQGCCGPLACCCFCLTRFVTCRQLSQAAASLHVCCEQVCCCLGVVGKSVIA